MAIIEVNNLQKDFKVYKREPGLKNAVKSLFSRDYQIKKAVDDISFSVNESEIVGYIGPNGAGKSTTIKMMSGILVPSSGEVIANGFIPYKERKKYCKKIGVVFGQRTQLFWDIPVIESYNLLRYLYKIPKNIYNENLEYYINVLDLKSFINTPVRQLSLGQKMKAEICGALLHNPDILFLDEPTIGLDLVAKKTIREIIKRINEKRGTTVILTSHDISDIQKLCDRIIIIDHGKIIFEGTIADLYKLYDSKKEIVFESDEIFPEKVSFKNFPINNYHINNNRLSVTFDPGTVNLNNLMAYIYEKFNVIDSVVKEPDIEDIVIQIYQQDNKK